MFARFYIIALTLCLLGCSQDVATETIARNKEKRIEESQKKYAETVQTKRIKQLAVSGNSVLNVPPKRILNGTKFKSQSGTVCYNIEKLPKPWFVVDVERHAKKWDSYLGFDFTFAALSTELDIPIFEVKVEPPVDYEFVTPYNEYVYTMVSAVPKDFVTTEYADSINFLSKTPIDYYKPFLFDVRDYAEWSFETFSSSGFNDLIGIDERSIASFKYRDAIELIDQEDVTLSNSPTAQFFSAPHAEGRFLHKSGKATVKIKFSAKAIPEASRLFDYANKVVSEIIVSCEDQ